MYAKLKTSLTGVAVALVILMVGYGLGELPRGAVALEIPTELLAEADLDAGAATLGNRRGALKRQMTMPYVSFAALLPRQES